MFFKNVSYLSILIVSFFLVSSVQAENFSDYKKIDWVSAPGINSFIKAPKSVGYVDYITVIDLTKNHIKLFGNSTTRVDGGAPATPFVEDVNTRNWLFPRAMVESIKENNKDVKFLWDAPFFNVTMSTTTLSLGLKSSDNQGTYITSGSRPGFDMEQPRRMIIIDNKTGLARIAEFDVNTFVNEGDQAVEGFDPMGSPSSKAEQASRVFLGVKNSGKELVVYCSKSASKEEASNALLDAGVALENQLQVDGGGSATCAYNLPGQYFVEPGRALPHIMGAVSILEKGKVTINNLNVRSSNVVGNNIVKKLPLNTEVTIYEEKGAWFRIAKDEWVSSQYIKKIKTMPYSAKVNIDNLNVRAGAGTGFAVTRRLPLNTEVTVYEEKNSWYRISETEWVMSSYLK